MGSSEERGQRPGWCVYYAYRDECGRQLSSCLAGVPYSNFASADFSQRPCFLDGGRPKPGALTCPKLRLPTKEEIATYEAWKRERLSKMIKVIEGILPWRVKHSGQNFSEVVECPACSGKLHLAISKINDHVHGHCETAGCVSWME